MYRTDRMLTGLLGMTSAEAKVSFSYGPAMLDNHVSYQQAENSSQYHLQCDAVHGPSHWPDTAQQDIAVGMSTEPPGTCLMFFHHIEDG